MSRAIDERRYKNCKRKRSEALINLWRLIVFSTSSCLLLWLITNQGWEEINAKKILVKGSTKINPKTVINASKGSFPNSLLYIKPRKLEQILLKELPIDSIIIKRRILPSSLEINIVERKPIAYATRVRLNGTEKGLLDEHAEWIPRSKSWLVSNPKNNLNVYGWMPSNKHLITTILLNRNQLGSSLEKIILTPDGEISIATKDLGTINLGKINSNSKLKKQLVAISHLNQALPKKFQYKEGTAIDLRDPLKPELELSPATKKTRNL